MLKKIISGGQSGADIAGLETAKRFGFETGGTMPFGFKTLDGSKPEYKQLYGVVAHSSSSYVPRTKKNVKDSDGTLRLAYDFESSGEKLTLRSILDYKKPYFDVDFNIDYDVNKAYDWLLSNNIKVLNIAGNSEKTAPGIYEKSCMFLESLFLMLN